MQTSLSFGKHSVTRYDAFQRLVEKGANGDMWSSSEMMLLGLGVEAKD